MDKEKLVILDLEGTLGNIFVEGYRRPWINIRPRVIGGLKRLLQNSHVVLASAADLEVISPLINYFKEQGFKFERLYDRLKVEPKFPENFDIMPFKDLSVIYQDWGIPSKDIEKKVVVVEDLQLKHDEIDKKQGDELIYGKNAESDIPHYNTLGNPLPYKGKVPVTILIPHLLKQKDYEAVEMTVIPDIIDELFELGKGDFLRGYDLFNKTGIKKLETTMFRKNKENFKRLYAQSEVLDNPFMKRLFEEFTHRYLIIQESQFPTQKYQTILIEQ